MGSIHQTTGQAWKVGTQNRNLGDREVPREKQPLHLLQGKIQCEMLSPLLPVLQLENVQRFHHERKGKERESSSILASGN